MMWSDLVEPAVVRLEVAGKFADGMTLDADGAAGTARALGIMARKLDAHETLDAIRSLRNQAYVELAKCAAVVALFVVGGFWFNG